MGVGVANADEHEEPESKKTVICHKGKTIEVSNNAVAAHEKHGDALGECPEE